MIEYGQKSLAKAVLFATRTLLLRSSCLGVLLCGLSLSWACNDSVDMNQAAPAPGTPTPGAPTPGAPIGADAGASDASADDDEEDEEENLLYRDEDFVEIDARNRDPFRDFLAMFANKPTDNPQRKVLLSDTAVDELTLIAIISGVAKPRAMVKDKDGVGHTLRRGDYVGRAEIVQGGADNLPVTLNWRVERIHPGEVVLTRPDPTGQDKAPLRRVIVLRDDES